MSWEALSAIGSLVSGLVIAASAVAAIIQIRQLRASTQLQGFVDLVRDYHSADVQAARRFVATQLPERLESEHYRAELSNFTADTHTHPELLLREFWEQLGSLMRHNVLDTPLFLEFFTIPCRLDWQRLAPVNKLLRQRNRYISEEFEYIANLCDRWYLSREEGGSPGVHVSVKQPE